MPTAYQVATGWFFRLAVTIMQPYQYKMAAVVYGLQLCNLLRSPAAKSERNIPPPTAGLLYGQNLGNQACNKVGVAQPALCEQFSIILRGEEREILCLNSVYIITLKYEWIN